MLVKYIVGFWVWVFFGRVVYIFLGFSEFVFYRYFNIYKRDVISGLVYLERSVLLLEYLMLGNEEGIFFEIGGVERICGGVIVSFRNFRGFG